jgi:hypothetical protein
MMIKIYVSLLITIALYIMWNGLKIEYGKPDSGKTHWKIEIYSLKRFFK